MECQLILVIEVLVRTLLFYDEHFGTQAQYIVEFGCGQALELTAEPFDRRYGKRVGHWLSC